MSVQINKMASITMMIRGALINVTALVGGSYLTKYLSGDQHSAVEEKKRRERRSSSTPWSLHKKIQHCC